MNKWKKYIALILLPAVLVMSSCGGAATGQEAEATDAAEGSAGIGGQAQQNEQADTADQADQTDAADQADQTDAAEQANQAGRAEEAEQAAADGTGESDLEALQNDMIVEEDAEAGKEKLSYDGQMAFVDGMAQPMLNYSEDTTDNGDSDILRLCVYVETDHDTDGDGKADLVKAYVQIPRSAAEGKYKAAVIYDPLPYQAGTWEKSHGVFSYPYAENSFDYSKLYEPGAKREPASEVSTLDAAMKANSEEWNYTVPGTASRSYYYLRAYDYYLIRGFAVVAACGIGTYGSEGFELCGTDLERDSHKCVVEWLTGKRTAYTDKVSNIAVSAADWCNGKVAMTGVSYGGTLPYEVATTGVEGLKTIIPIAGISNWYDYRNSQGVSTYAYPTYTDYLASFNSGGLFEDDNWLVQNDSYGAWIRQRATDEIKANGNYEPVWAELDYSDDHENIKCSALIIHGLNDFNVLTKQSDLMYKAFKKAGQNVKLIWHQDGHNTLQGTYVGDTLFDELLNKWLSHYLYDIDNGIENMAEITVQSNLDGTYSTYDSWGEAEYTAFKPASGNAADDAAQDQAVTQEQAVTQDKAAAQDQAAAQNQTDAAAATQDQAAAQNQTDAAAAEQNAAGAPAQEAAQTQPQTAGPMAAATQITDETATGQSAAAEQPAAVSETLIKSGNFDNFYRDYLATKLPFEVYYTNMDESHAATYTIEVPAGATIYGIPEVHVKLKTPDIKQDNLMVTAILLDTDANGKNFKAYMTNRNQYDTLPVKTVGTYEYGGNGATGRIREYVKSATNAVRFSVGWTDLLDPGTGYISSENKAHTATEANKYYDYTLYLTPTVYTVAEGHNLKLMIFAQDPYRSRMDDALDSTPDFADNKVDEVYSFTIDNASVEVKLPIAK